MFNFSVEDLLIMQ